MRKLKSLSVIALLTLLLSACSGKSEVEQANQELLFSKAQIYVQNADYSQAIRYFDALETRFPGSLYSEQAKLNLIYAAYKTQDYTKALITADKFLKSFPQSQHTDYVLYMAGLTNASTGDSLVQDFFKIDRATRENTTMKTAFSNFQTLVTYFPNSPYTADAIARMAYIKDRLARHELEVARFYAKRSAWIAVANRVDGMLKVYPDTAATLKALPLMQQAYQKLGLTELEKKVTALIEANKNSKLADIEKPKQPSLKLP